MKDRDRVLGSISFRWIHDNVWHKILMIKPQKRCIFQDHKSFPCRREKDREEGVENPEDQGKPNCQGLREKLLLQNHQDFENALGKPVMFLVFPVFFACFLLGFRSTVHLLYDPISLDTCFSFHLLSPVCFGVCMLRLSSVITWLDSCFSIAVYLFSVLFKNYF
ncbi:hypothetical protein Droror1_Dr00021098 [Drosera rotundifolia]